MKLDIREALIANRWRLLVPAERRDWYRSRPDWEQDRLIAINRSLTPSDTVFDIGAELGDQTALYAQRIGESGRVVIVEPAPQPWPHIRAIWEANRLPLPAACFVGFVGEHTDLDPPNNDIGFPLHTAVDFDPWPPQSEGRLPRDGNFRHLSQQSDATPTITLDDLSDMTMLMPDVITIDVEGSELAVLRGAERTLRAIRPLLYLSVHPAFLRDMYDTDSGDLYDHLHALGYETELLHEDGHEDHVVAWHPDGRLP